MTQQSNSESGAAGSNPPVAGDGGAALNGGAPNSAAGGSTPAAASSAPAVPDKYADFKLADGLTLDADTLAQVQAEAKTRGLDQAGAQSLAEYTAKLNKSSTERTLTKLAAERTAWADASKADPEFGGEKLAENLATAKLARDKYASPKLVELLESTGLGSHPEVVRFFLNVGKTLQPDTNVNGSPPGQQVDTSDEAKARRMYPTMNAA